MSDESFADVGSLKPELLKAAMDSSLDPQGEPPAA